MTRKELKAKRTEVYTALVKGISGDNPALSLLPDTHDSQPRKQFTELLWSLACAYLSGSSIDFLPNDLFISFITWCKDPKHDIPIPLELAIEERDRMAQPRRRAHRRLVRRLGLLERSDVEKDLWLFRHTESVRLPALNSAYPSEGEWIAESLQIDLRWRAHIEHGKQADRRLKRHPLVREDPEKLAYIVRENESVVVRDRDSGAVVLVVLRCFCPDDKVLAGVVDTQNTALDMRKSIRLEDTGKLVSLGYTAGARSRPSFDWAKNVLKKTHDPNFIKEHDFRVSSVFALFWALLRARLPDEILAAYKDYLDKHDMCRMDGNQKRGNVPGEYIVEWGDETLEFSGVELAPPAGVAGCNYARAIHHETQPQKWAFSWTTSRRTNMKRGGAFYLARYGIKVSQAANTMVAWMPEHPHGTSLLPCGPGKEVDVPPFAQAGLCFVTSTRLAKTWRSYCEHRDAEQAKLEYAASLEHDVEKSRLCDSRIDDDYPCFDLNCPVCT